VSFQVAIAELIGFIDRYDTFKDRDRDLSFFSVALGTLRKDQLLAQDILTLSSSGSEGIGTMALSRIMTEDYLHLLYLNHNQDNLESNIDRFNTHPYIQHYIAIQMLKELGFRLDSPEEKKMIAQASAEFETHGAKFLRRKKSSTFNSDDYSRTWTGIGLDSLIKKTGLTSTDGDMKSLKFMTETYDMASSVIHHNSFLIWLFATQDREIFLNEYPEFSQRIVFITLNKLIALVFEIEQTVSKDEKKQARLLNELTDIMELA
jgi:hypothetical protein